MRCEGVGSVYRVVTSPPSPWGRRAAQRMAGFGGEVEKLAGLFWTRKMDKMEEASVVAVPADPSPQTVSLSFHRHGHFSLTTTSAPGCLFAAVSVLGDFGLRARAPPAPPRLCPLLGKLLQPQGSRDSRHLRLTQSLVAQSPGPDPSSVPVSAKAPAVCPVVGNGDIVLGPFLPLEPTLKSL